ncbi:MAG: ECF transporter S component [Ruminococcaceae bacterium]|nr:ECF transporter S component [Oscillospiraceae bacterium]
MKTKTQKIVLAALFAALACIATLVIKIPSPLKGYINLGDCIVLLAGWLLFRGYGFMAAGLGSALADLILGYAVYAPVTFVVKGTMALAASLGSGKGLVSKLVSGVAAELVMILGYYVFEGFMYGFGPAAINIPANAVQGVAGLVIGIILVKIFEKHIK